MFRKSAYERVGGYREAFYYAQDSDLWLRLAEIGFIVYCPEVLYNYSVNLQSISAQKRHLQERFGKLGRLCHDARSSGRSEAQFLSQAKELTEQIRSGAHTGRHGATEVHTTRYLIGTQLARQGNVRALRYLLPIVLRQPWNVKVWFRIVQAVAGRKTKIVGQ
jgi:hypothetical protein